MNCGCLKPKCNSPNPVVFQCTDNDERDVEFVDLAELLPRVTLVAKGVPDDVALEYLRQAAQTLARDSLILQRDVRLDVQAGVRDYYLNHGENEQVHYVEQVALTSGLLSSFFCKNAFVFEPNDKIILRKAPKQDAENQLFVRYFAIPSQTACQIDKLMFDRYHEVVVNGALADLLLMRHYEFADPQMALLYEKRFKQGVAQAKIDVAKAFQNRQRDLNQWERI